MSLPAIKSRKCASQRTQSKQEKLYSALNNYRIKKIKETGVSEGLVVVFLTAVYALLSGIKIKSYVSLSPKPLFNLLCLTLKEN